MCLSIFLNRLVDHADFACFSKQAGGGGSKVCLDLSIYPNRLVDFAVPD